MSGSSAKRKTRTVRTKVAALSTPVVIAAGLVLAAPAPAFAAGPSGCRIYAHPTGQVDGRMARCTSGTGSYRLALRCNEGAIYGLPDYFVYGPWRAPSRNNQSIASCFTGKTSGFFRAASIHIRY